MRGSTSTADFTSLILFSSSPLAIGVRYSPSPVGEVQRLLSCRAAPQARCKTLAAFIYSVCENRIQLYAVACLHGCLPHTVLACAHACIPVRLCTASLYSALVGAGSVMCSLCALSPCSVVQ